MAYMLPRDYRIEGMTDQELQTELAMEQDPALRDQYQHELEMRAFMARDFNDRQAQGEFSPEELAKAEAQGLKSMSNDEAMDRQRRDPNLSDLINPANDAVSDDATVTPVRAGNVTTPGSPNKKASNEKLADLKSDEVTHFETGTLDDHLARGKAVAVQIRDGSGHKTHGYYVHQPDNGVFEMRDPTRYKGFILAYLSSFVQAVKDSVFPADPHMVAPDYWVYQYYDAAQAFCSTILSLVATRSVLEGLGVGDPLATATSAVIISILKDLISRIATVGFAWRIGLFVEQEAKYYRFLADCLNDSATLLDLATPSVDWYFRIVLLITAEALRALCGVAANSSKAALSHHFARGNNLAELNAKEASQETLTGLMGLFVGSWIVTTFTELSATYYPIISFFTGAHLIFNYLGIRSVALDVMNRQRATILMQHYLAYGEVLTPRQVADKEAILFYKPGTIMDRRGKGTFKLAMARSYAEMTPDRHDNGDYIITFNSRANEMVGAKIFITRRRDIGQENFAILKAWYHGVATAWQKSHMGWDAEDLMHRDRFWREAEEAGWKLNEQGIETGAPIRIWYNGQEAPRGGEKKDQ